MKRRISFVAMIFVMSLIFGFTLRSYAATETSVVTADDFRRAISHDLELLGKDGIGISVRTDKDIVELKFHDCEGRNDCWLNAGDTDLDINGSIVYVDMETRNVMVCGNDRYDGKFVVRNLTLEETFNM